MIKALLLGLGFVLLSGWPLQASPNRVDQARCVVGPGDVIISVATAAPAKQRGLGPGDVIISRTAIA